MRAGIEACLIGAAFPHLIPTSRNPPIRDYTSSLCATFNAVAIIIIRSSSSIRHGRASHHPIASAQVPGTATSTGARIASQAPSIPTSPRVRDSAARQQMLKRRKGVRCEVFDS